MKAISGCGVLIAAVLFLASTAVAADPPRRPKIDANGDGVVDFVEMQEVNPNLTVDEFNKMDSNRDGQLVPEELASAFSAKMIKRIDADGDGSVTLAEMEATGPRHPEAAEQFRQFDTDGDGKLNSAEFTAMHDAMRKEFESMRGKPGRRPPGSDAN